MDLSRYPAVIQPRHPQRHPRIRIDARRWDRRPDELLDVDAYLYSPEGDEMGLECWRSIEGVDKAVDADTYDIWFTDGRCVKDRPGYFPIYITEPHFKILLESEKHDLNGAQSDDDDSWLNDPTVLLELDPLQMISEGTNYAFFHSPRNKRKMIRIDNIEFTYSLHGDQHSAGSLHAKLPKVTHVEAKDAISAFIEEMFKENGITDAGKDDSFLRDGDEPDCWLVKAHDHWQHRHLVVRRKSLATNGPDAIENFKGTGSILVVPWCLDQRKQRGPNKMRSLIVANLEAVLFSTVTNGVA